MKRRVVLKAHVKPGAHSVIGHGNVKFLHVAMQHGTPTVWFEADEYTPLSTKDNADHQQGIGDTIGVLSVLTGEAFNKPENYVFLGSAVSDHFVVHVYVEKKYVGDHHY
uniref:DUF7352 domain-containing protein n=1 Tax=Klebsiella phage vB_Kpn2-P2 TaxID=3230849 RepID=A0AAU8EGA5_9VIRU